VIEKLLTNADSNSSGPGRAAGSAIANNDPPLLTAASSVRFACIAAPHLRNLRRSLQEMGSDGTVSRTHSTVHFSQYFYNWQITQLHPRLPGVVAASFCDR
jgi:hypothetical protein